MPEGMNRLINMRHLYAEAETISLIDGIGRLTDLQELEEFRITRKRGHRIGELKELRNLRRRLVIKNLESVESREEVMEANLKNKEYLNALCLNWKSQSDPEEHMLEGLEPHYSLKGLTFQNYGGVTLPNWLVKKQYLINLESVFLIDCTRCASLPPLGQLPFLKVLHIHAMPAVKRIGVEFYGDADQVFPSLEDLEFRNLLEWEEWSHTEGRQFFPRLRLLYIFVCPKLRKAPLHYLSSPVLIEFKINECGDLGDALPRCLQSLTSLVILELWNYPHRTSVCLSNLTHLESLFLISTELSLLTGFRSLTSLKRLRIQRCPKLNDFLQTEQPYGDPDLKSLFSFRTDDIPFNNVWITLETVRSLHCFILDDCDHLAHFNVEQEEWFQKLISLEELEIKWCRNLQSLPTNLVTFPSIKKLTISHCPEIKSLPENGLPASLTELHIGGCPLLKERCIKDQGLDWQLIAHVPYICIDGEAV